jgi:ubiquinone/menaquinone biosynthesis C-methylase UbiE
MKMTNQRNQVIYRRWARLYDATVARLFMPGRRRLLDLLNLQPGGTVLLSGVGTGEDLPFLPGDVFVLGIDLSSHMLSRARPKLRGCHASALLAQADAQRLPVSAGAFDAVVLSLILSVVPDGRLCLQEALRALRPGGCLFIFDKFLGSSEPSVLRRLLNFFSTRLGTDINRRFTAMLPSAGCCIIRDEASIAGGMYRIIVVQKSLRESEK